MSYQTREVSSQDGTPIALYEIVWGSTVWRYTSADADVTVDLPGEEDVLFTAIAITDSGMTQGGSSNNDLAITAPSNIPLADLFHSTPPSDEIKMTVRRQHQGEVGVPFIYWKGFVQNVKRDEGNASIRIVGVSIGAMFESQGLRLGWTRGCPHILYDSECRADPEAFVVEAEIVAMDGNSITVDTAGGHPVGYFTGGYIQWEANADGTLDRRGIMASETELKLILLGTTYRLEIGLAVKLYPGCDLTDETCDLKFNNLPNYGGCRQMTGKNPFDGTAIV